MFQVRRAKERGYFDHGWLKTFHTFSFGEFYDPRFMGFRSLRVINEDVVEAGKGFDTHGHKDMEIVTYVLKGSLQHRDSLGTGSVIRPGEVQRMTAGTGIRHSEFNASVTEPVHLLQIWILPEGAGLTPAYEQKNFAAALEEGHRVLLASRSGDEGSVTIHQDVRLYGQRLKAGATVSYDFAETRHAWIQVTAGEMMLTESKQPVRLEAGDSASISGSSGVDLEARSDSEVLVFDLA
jgi:quercetin 2,3-dioxygenase